MKLLGGSNHGKRIDHDGDTIIMPTRSNTFGHLYPKFSIDREIYDRKRVQYVYFDDATQSYIKEVREAFVCRGRKVKDSTVFKYGSPVRSDKINLEVFDAI